MNNIVERDSNLDLIKFIAIIATISIHVIAPGFNSEIFSKTWYFFVIAGSLFRFCVPVFAMTSGYLLYTRKEISNKKIFNSILKFLLIFIFAEIMYRFISCLYIKFYFHNEISFVDMKLDILKGHYKDHLYYLFIIIFIYAFAPICNLIVNKEKGELKSLLIIWIICSLTLNLIISVSGIEFFNIFNRYILSGAYNYVMFALLGAYIKKYKDKFMKINFLIYFLIFLISYLLIVFLTLKISSDVTGMVIWDSNNLLIFGLSLGLFGMGIKINIKNLTSKKIFALVASNTLIIYIIHVIFTDYLMTAQLNYVYFDGLSKVIIAVIEIVGVFILSLIISIFIKFIKRKLNIKSV